MRTHQTALVAIWLVSVMKLFLPALLIYFFAFKPLCGDGHGAAYTLVYILAFCPAVAVYVGPKLLKKMEEKKAMETA